MAIVCEKAIANLKNFESPDAEEFGKILVPAMVTCTYKNGVWGDLELKTYGPLQIDPAAKVLHYAQEIFEGLKAYKNDHEEIFLFRPEMNARRFNYSATRLSMPTFPEELFIQSLDLLVSYSPHCVGPRLGASFYLRPFMIGDEPQLGVKPSSSYLYVLIGGPSGPYFSGDYVKVFIERKFHRAAPLGTGRAKTGGNYASSLASHQKSKSMGLDQTLWLDPVEGRYIEELSGMNFFALINGVLTTPPVSESILHGVTRDSLLTLAKSMGMSVSERRIEINELLKQIESGDCSEAFACGTASVLSPIGTMTDGEKKYKLKNPSGKTSVLLKEKLLLIQSGRAEDPFHWRRSVTPR